MVGQQDVVQDKTAIKHPVEAVHTKKTYRRKQQYKTAVRNYYVWGEVFALQPSEAFKTGMPC